MVFQDMTLDDELTAYENLEMHGRLYGVEKEGRGKKIIELLKLVDLEDRKDSLVKTFSGGMKRRLEIARGLLHEPKILFLDEPTLGLDPQTRNKLWEYIERLNKDNGLTIILTTHYMEEADKLSNRIAIIDKGTIIALDTPDNLKKRLGGDIVTIETEKSEKLEHLLKKQTWCKSVKRHDHSVTIDDKNGIIIDSTSIHKPSLEDVFLYFTGKTIREQEADSKDTMRERMKRRGRR
jgi:ABC-2 type transport system ATP-binding protein